MLSSSAISVSAANDLDRILLGSSSTSSITISTARPPRPLPPVPSHQQPLQGPASVAAAAAPAATSTMTDNSNGNTPDDDNGPFACKWRGCSLVFDDPEDLFAHCTNDHVGRKSAGSLCLKCAWLVPDPGANGQVMECGIEKAKRDHITSHIRVHVPLKPHQCAQCSKRFKRPQDLKKHERTHTHTNGADVVGGAGPGDGGEVNNNEHVPHFVHPSPPSQQHQVPAVTVSQPQQFLQGSPLAMPTPVPTSAYLAPATQSNLPLSQSPHFLPQQPLQQQHMQPSPAAQHFLHVASPMSPATHGFSPTAPAVNLIPPRSSSHQVSLAGSTPSSSLSMSMSPLAMPNGNMPTPSPLNFNINGIPNGTTSGAALSLGQQPQQQHPYITPNFMPYDNAQTPSPITKAANYPNAMQAGGGLAMNNLAGRQPSPMPYPLTPDSSSSGGMGSSNNGYMQQPQQQFHYSFDQQPQLQQSQHQGMYTFGSPSNIPQFAHMPQAADFPARSLPLKRDAYDDMDELDLFLDNVKKAKITPSYNDGLAQSLDYLAPGLLSGNLLQTPILATMPASDSTTVLGFLDQLESAVCQQDADIAAFLDQLDAGVFAADPMLAGASEMPQIHHAPPPPLQQQQPMFTSFAQHSQLPPPTQAQQPVQQPATTRSSSTTSSSSSSCYPGHYSTTTGASLGAAIGLPEAHVMSPSPSSPSPTPAPVDRDRAKAAGAKKQKDKNVLFELRSTSSAEPSTKDLKKKKSKDNVLKAVVDQVAAAASASSSANGARSGPPVSKPLGQFMRVAQDLVGGGSSSSSSSSTRSAAAAARSPTNPPALPPRSPIPAASSDMDALAGAMSSMSIHTPAPASHALVNPAVQRAVYHIRAIRALRWHLHDQIAAEKRQREGAAAAGTAGTEAPVSVS